MKIMDYQYFYIIFPFKLMINVSQSLITFSFYSKFLLITSILHYSFLISPSCPRPLLFGLMELFFCCYNLENLVEIVSKISSLRLSCVLRASMVLILLDSSCSTLANLAACQFWLASSACSSCSICDSYFISIFLKDSISSSKTLTKLSVWLSSSMTDFLVLLLFNSFSSCSLRFLFQSIRISNRSSMSSWFQLQWLPLLSSSMDSVSSLLTFINSSSDCFSKEFYYSSYLFLSRSYSNQLYLVKLYQNRLVMILIQNSTKYEMQSKISLS